MSVQYYATFPESTTNVLCPVLNKKTVSAWITFAYSIISSLKSILFLYFIRPLSDLLCTMWCLGGSAGAGAYLQRSYRVKAGKQHWTDQRYLAVLQSANHR